MADDLEMKNLRSVVDKLEQLLSCNSCCSIASDPCQLNNCNHLYCKVCADNYVGDKCQICGIPVQVKDCVRIPDIADVVEQYKRLRKIVGKESSREKSVSSRLKKSDDELQTSASSDESPASSISSEIDENGGNPNEDETTNNIDKSPEISEKAVLSDEIDENPIDNISVNSVETAKVAEKNENHVENETETPTPPDKAPDNTEISGDAVENPSKSSDETPIASEKGIDDNSPENIIEAKKSDENQVENMIKLPTSSDKTFDKIENSDNSVENSSSPSVKTPSASEKQTDAGKTDEIPTETDEIPTETLPQTRNKTTAKISRKRTDDATNKSDDNSDTNKSVTSVKTPKTAKRKTLDETDTTTSDENTSTKSLKTPTTSEKIIYNKNNTSITNIKTPKTVEKRNRKGETSLHLAAIKGNFEDVQELIQQNFDVNAKDNAGWTPLHEAVVNGNKNVVAILLDNGALIDSPGNENNTPLHEACLNNHVDIVSMLVRRGANLNAKNIHGIIPKMYAYTFELKDALKTPVLGINNTSFVNFRKKEMVFSMSGLKEDERLTVIMFASEMGIKMEKNMFDETATHLITKCNVDEPKTCPRTMKYMVGILTGKWIVDYSWITACLDSESLVDESDYEITGSTSNPNTNAPQNSRENSSKNLPRLFSGCNFYLHGDFESPSKTELIQLAKISGAKILKRLPVESTLTSSITFPFHAWNTPLQECSNYVIYCNPSTKPSKIENTEYLKILPVKFFFQCISKFKLSLDYE